MFRKEIATLVIAAVLLSGAAAIEIQNGPTPGPGLFTLIYATPWNPAYLHYNPDGNGWNKDPGAKMGCPTNASYSCNSYKEITVPGESVVWVLDNGHGSWDNNGGRNYEVGNSGIYLLDDGHVTTLQTFADRCPGATPCNGHGTCNKGICSCSAGWFGVACDRQCKCGTHETCDSEGYCVCQTGWGNCSKQGCNVNTADDPKNCGSCGHSCYGANVASASCAAGKCSSTCNPGFKLCGDGVCQKACGLPGCQTYQTNQCSGNTITTAEQFWDHKWQTPPANESFPSYQDMGRLTAYPQVTYTASDHTAATVTLKYFVKNNFTQVQCSFNNGPFGACSASFSKATHTGPLPLALRGSDGSELELDPVDFIWDHPEVKPVDSSGDYRQGQKGSIVEMFGWRHVDIMNECRFIAKAGFMGVKFFPVQEQLMASQPFQNVMNPWYFMYQPVSYRLQGRMGNRDELRDAINYCRSLGVRTYADAVTNHMTGCGNDGIPLKRNGQGGGCTYWPMKNTSADYPPQGNKKNGSSPFYTQCFNWMPNPENGLSPQQEFPSVPYTAKDFHCERALNSWTSPLDLNAGWLTGLVDLNTELDYVQQRIADYLTDLLGIGFSGFRMDAAKHIRPPDLAKIFAKVKANLGGTFPPDFIAWLEVLTGGEGNMLLCNPNSDYSYSKGLERALLGEGLTQDDVNKIKIWFDAYPKQPGLDCGQLEMNRKAIQNDDADQQNPGSTSRDMGSQGTVLVIAKNIPLHQHFEEKLFLDPNGASDNDNDYPIRMVLSSYWLPKDESSYGVPDGNSNCDKCKISCSSCNPAGSVDFTAAYKEGAPAYGTMPSNRFTRTHRFLGTINAMRKWMHMGPMSQEEHDEINKE